MAAMTIFFPATGAEADWNAAYYRLEDYLRALHVVNKVHQSQIIIRLLNAAAARHAREPERSPTELAMEEARGEMEQWFQRVLRRQDRALVVGLVAMLTTDASQKWPAAFLSEEIPVEMQRAMQESEVRAGPDFEMSSMVPRPIDVSPLVEGLLKDGWEKLESSTVLLAFGALAAVAALLFFVITR